MAYLYFLLSLSMAVASFFMIRPKSRMLIRALGLILAYIAAGIALKAFYLLS